MNTDEITIGGGTVDLTTVVVQWHGDTLIVTLHRPHRLNAFDATMRAELRELWELRAQRAVCAPSSSPERGAASARELMPEIWLPA
jgi:hypothetical protein